MTVKTRPGAPDATTAPGASGRPPGKWPATPTTDELYLTVMRERARRELVLGSIKASLEEQPSARSARACARNWVADVIAIAEDVARSKMEHQG